MGPVDGSHIMLPRARGMLDRLAKNFVLVGHSNYGCEFGFEPLETTPAVLRHVPLARTLNSPWVSDHCFYGDSSWSDIWSSPIQFSRQKLERVAARARALQLMYGSPLAHENAAYYLPCPGSEMREAEFLARLVDAAGTYLHLDLHNLYCNAINLPHFDIDDYLATIPLDRVVAIHLAGGSWSEEMYHDWHDCAVPPPVWELLDTVLGKARPAAVILEFQGQAHHQNTRVLDARDQDVIQGDICRAKAAWQHHYGPTAPRRVRAQEEVQHGS